MTTKDKGLLCFLKYIFCVVGQNSPYELTAFHPKQLNRRAGKLYPIVDLAQFNNMFLEYYCLIYPQKKIAELLHIDRGTVRRRIKFMRSLHHFKLRFCKRCNNLFRFRATEYQRSAKICSRCRLSCLKKQKDLNIEVTFSNKQ